MKKYALIILICICFALTFSSCAAKEQTVSFTQEVSEISSICVYNVQGSYDFENVGDLYDEDAPLHTIDKENYDVISTVFVRDNDYVADIGATCYQ